MLLEECPHIHSTVKNDIVQDTLRGAIWNFLWNSDLVARAKATLVSILLKLEDYGNWTCGSSLILKRFRMIMYNLWAWCDYWVITWDSQLFVFHVISVLQLYSLHLCMWGLAVLTACINTSLILMLSDILQISQKRCAWQMDIQISCIDLQWGRWRS